MVDLVSAVVADEQSFVVVEPGEGALDDPADFAEAGAVVCLSACDDGGDATLAEEAAVLVVVVATVGVDLVGALARSASFALHRWDPVEQWDQLGDVVAVTAGRRVRERDPRAVDEEVMLRAGSAAINWARARFGAPFFACTWLPSTTVRFHSSSPACCNRLNSSWCNRSQTPAFCHSSSRR